MKPLTGPIRIIHTEEQMRHGLRWALAFQIRQGAERPLYDAALLLAYQQESIDALDDTLDAVLRQAHPEATKEDCVHACSVATKFLIFARDEVNKKIRLRGDSVFKDAVSSARTEYPYFDEKSYEETENALWADKMHSYY